MVYAKYFGRLQLVPAEALSQACQRAMGDFDKQPDQIRDHYRQINEPAPEYREQPARAVAMGFGLMT